MDAVVGVRQAALVRP